MVRKFIFPVMAVAGLGLAFSFNGCSCHAEMGDQQAKAPEPPPPPPPPPEPTPPPAPPPVGRRLVAVGKASIEGNRVKIPGELEFDVDKASIKDTTQSKDILNTLSEFMKQNPNVTKLRVEGHTDNTGTAEHNQKLSQERADSVVKWLGDHGVDKTRLIAVGFGQTKPIAQNDTAANKQINRRTEFHVQDVDGKPATDEASAVAGGSADAGAPATSAKAGTSTDAGVSATGAKAASTSTDAGSTTGTKKKP